MKIKTSSLAAILGLCMAVSAPVSAGNFDKAVKQATAEIDNAKAMNYEWRDSRKMLKQAQKLYDQGDKKKAMKLVAAAQEQGKLAVAQAKAQANNSGPH